MSAVPPRLLLATVLALACGSAATLPAPAPPDARAPADAALADAALADAAIPVPDATPDLGAPSPVTGSESGRWLNSGTDLVVPVNHASTKVAVWSHAGGGWSYLPGKGAADGSLSVPGVPAGPFVLTFFGNYFASSTERAFQLDYYRLGRPDHPAPKLRPTTLTLDLSGLRAWQAKDRLEYFAPNAPSADWVLASKLAPALVEGATGVQGSLDWGGLQWNALIDGPGHADMAWFVQLSTSAGDQGAIYQTATRALASSNVKVVDGQPVTVAGAMLELPASQSIDVEFPVPDYAALGQAVSPVAGHSAGYYVVVTFPGASRVGYDSGAGDLFMVGADAETPSLKLKASYGNPYPPGWGTIANVSFAYPVPVLIPGASNRVSVPAIIHSSDLVSRLGTGRASPFVTPVLEPKINGQPAFNEIVHATATPAISWQPPATGKPTLYTIDVLHARLAGGTATLESVAMLYTEDTHFDLPPDVLQFGESYVLRIRAMVGDGLSVTTPWAWPAHIGWAECVTARLSP
jgi:hypothetical protein